MPVVQHPPFAVVPLEEEEHHGSFHSTVSVDDAPIKKIKSNDRVRTVSFDFSKTVEYTSPAIDQYYSNETWYSKHECREMKHCYLKLGKEFQQYDASVTDKKHSFKVILCKAHDACRNATDDPQSYLLNGEDEALLRKWLSKGNRTGLETISVLKIGAEKVARRRQLSAAILQAQLDHKSAQEIRDISREITRPSRLFSWRLAYKQVHPNMA